MPRLEIYKNVKCFDRPSSTFGIVKPSTIGLMWCHYAKASHHYRQPTGEPLNHTYHSMPCHTKAVHSIIINSNSTSRNYNRAMTLSQIGCVVSHSWAYTSLGSHSFSCVLYACATAVRMYYVVVLFWLWLNPKPEYIQSLLLRLLSVQCRVFLCTKQM